MRIKKSLPFIFIMGVLLWGNACQGDSTSFSSSPGEKVKPGVEVFLEKHLDLVKGKRVGLITNPTGVDSHLNTTIDLFYEHPGIQLAALYGPEHGVRGNAQAGEYVPFYIDQKYNLPVFSLYGQSRKPPPGMFENIDDYMRSFDTEEKGKIPPESMVEDVDVMVFDIQDVGTRIYTYAATMAYCMQACAEKGVEFIVLDRPNPINGLTMEGPVLEYPQYSSFVGLYPIPVRHGMTAGELARLFNEQFMDKKVSLTVIPMKNWKRDMWYDETSLPWVIPSPNMPSLSTALVYPGQVFLEGTNVSEGRGTTRPFELFGAPWIDGYELVQRLNDKELPGVKFREAWFTPVFSKYKKKLCGGAQIHVVERERFHPFRTTLHIIQTIRKMHPDRFQFHKNYFDQIMGTSFIRKSLFQGLSIREIRKKYEKDLNEFSRLRKEYLLY
ncbi:DUF1343 domain-containing protein [bacterium]|nr:DUF1343 domain-containing protein [bacterium]